MDKKLILGLVIGLIIGLVVGFFVCTKGTGGEHRGEWPMVLCPEGNLENQMAADVCDQIAVLGMQAQPPAPEAQLCAQKALQIKSATPPDPLLASQGLYRALQAAQQGDWATCRRELDEIG